MTTHELKIWPQHFDKVQGGVKKFEVRMDDRGYQIGDLLHLREWDPMSELYTDREIMACIGYVHRGWGLLPGFCILGFE